MCRFKRSFAEIERILAVVTAFCRKHGAEADAVFACELAVEELFTNFVKYNRPGTGEIRLDCERRGGALVLTLSDFDVEPFDLAQVPAVDVTAPIERRRPGGLGLHLVRAYMDEFHYGYHERTMRITVIKRLEADHV